ncbi:MAG: hypothetical protein ACHQCI_09175, partial [Solirubrobacterales bacterium]
MEVKSITEQKSLLATLSPGKRARLRRLLFDYGPGNGTLMLLPIDQGIEHGPRDFFPNPASKDPEYQFSLAAEADLAGDRRVAGRGGEAEMVHGVLGGGFREEVAGAVLDPLVDRQQHQGPVAGAVVEQQPA